MIRAMFLHPLCALLFSLQVTAVQAQSMPPDGCGSGWNTNLVPDYIPILGCELQSCCDKHDLCYGACEGNNPELGLEACKYRDCKPGGSLHGTEICETIEYKRSLREAEKRKSKCDETFYDNIIAVNSTKPVCQVFGLIYKTAVVTWGKSAFIGVTPATSEMTAAEKEQSEQAFKQFLQNGTEGEFLAFTESMQSGARPIDVTRPLKYDLVTRKLTNSR